MEILANAIFKGISKERSFHRHIDINGYISKKNDFLSDFQKKKKIFQK